MFKERKDWDGFCDGCPYCQIEWYSECGASTKLVVGCDMEDRNMTDAELANAVCMEEVEE